MKRRKQRVVLDVTFREPITAKEAQNAIAQLAEILLDESSTLQRIVAKEFSRVLRAEQRKARNVTQRNGNVIVTIEEIARELRLVGRTAELRELLEVILGGPDCGLTLQHEGTSP